jgi:hypothetical protein
MDQHRRMGLSGLPVRRLQSRMSAVGVKTWAIVDALENEGPTS